MFEYKINVKSLTNKVILVTGAGDGIGKQAAITYANLGATVVLLGKTVSKLEQVYDIIVDNGAAQPAIIPLDFRGATKQNYIDMVDTIVSQCGKLDGALLNAGMLGDLAPFTHIEEHVFTEVMKVNVEGQFLLAQALIPALQDAEHGSLVFTSSGVANQGKAYWGAYCLSKCATVGMMQIIADEYSNTSLRTNAINPGATRTLMRAKAYPGEDKLTLATPEDIMPLYVYLMSDDSININGQQLNAQ